MLSMIYLIFSRVGEVDPLWEKLAGKMRFVPRKCVKWVTIALKFSLQILLFYAMKYFVKPETDNYFKILRKRAVYMINSRSSEYLVCAIRSAT